MRRTPRSGTFVTQAVCRPCRDIRRRDVDGNYENAQAVRGRRSSAARNHPRRLRGNSIRPRRNELAAAGVSGADPARADA